MVSVVLPVYNERDNLAPLLVEADAALRSIEHEIVAVDDGSTDGSLDELRRLRVLHPSLRIVALQRRAGQSAALVAGFAAARGDIVVTMDADGQNDPADILLLLRILDRDETCGAVVGYRVGRADSGWKRLQGRVANVVRNRLTADRIRDTGCALKAMRREVLAKLPQFDGMHRFLPTLVRRQGGRVVETPVTHRPRMSGKSKYSMANRIVVTLYDAFGVRWLGRRALRYTAREETS